jgi:hypothetical protein
MEKERVYFFLVFPGGLFSRKPSSRPRIKTIYLIVDFSRLDVFCLGIKVEVYYEKI